MTLMRPEVDRPQFGQPSYERPRFPAPLPPANQRQPHLRSSMAKRPRETVEVQDFAAAIEPDDDSCEEEEVDAKEQLLKEGNAEEAWQLYLDEEQAKYWRAVSVEVCCCPPPGSLPSLQKPTACGWLCARLRMHLEVPFRCESPALRADETICAPAPCAGECIPGPVRQPRPASRASQASHEGGLVLQPKGAPQKPSPALTEGVAPAEQRRRAWGKPGLARALVSWCDASSVKRSF
jgi:hypothetical protein